MFDAPQDASDDESSTSYRQLERAKRAVSCIDPQWADLFDRAERAIERSRWIQRQLGDVLQLAARIFGRRGSDDDHLSALGS